MSVPSLVVMELMGATPVGRVGCASRRPCASITPWTAACLRPGPAKRALHAPVKAHISLARAGSDCHREDSTQYPPLIFPTPPTASGGDKDERCEASIT